MNATAETPSFTGLDTDADGDYFFLLDDSGTALVLRVDVPLSEFEKLYFDGELWSLGDDYTVRSGSTILTIEASRLETLAEGWHLIQAVFASSTLNVEFILNKLPTTEQADGLAAPADVGSTETRSAAAPPVAPVAPTKDAAAGSGMTALLLSIVGVAALAAVFLFLKRRTRSATAR